MEAKTKTVALLGVLLGPVLGLGACSTTQERMSTWVGTTDAHLMSAWGAPDRKAAADGGIRVLTYRQKGTKYQAACQMTFAIDADHRVIAANTDCR